MRPSGARRSGWLHFGWGGAGKNRTTHRHTVSVFHLAGKALPWFTLAPEHVFHRLGAVFGYHDIDFPHHHEFSRAYFLRGKEEPAIRALFQPPVVAGLAQSKGWVVEGGADRLLIYRPGKRLAPEQLRQFLTETSRLAQLFA